MLFTPFRKLSNSLNTIYEFTFLRYISSGAICKTTNSYMILRKTVNVKIEHFTVWSVDLSSKHFFMPSRRLMEETFEYLKKKFKHLLNCNASYIGI